MTLKKLFFLFYCIALSESCDSIRTKNDDADNKIKIIPIFIMKMVKNKNKNKNKIKIKIKIKIKYSGYFK